MNDTMIEKSEIRDKFQTMKARLDFLRGSL